MTIRHLRGGVAVIGTAAEFASANPVLLARQLSLETDTGREKIGDGTTTYRGLDYLPGGASAPLRLAPTGVDVTPLALKAATGSEPGVAVVNIEHTDGTPNSDAGYGVAHLDSDGGGAFAGERIQFSQFGALSINLDSAEASGNGLHLTDQESTFFSLEVGTPYVLIVGARTAAQTIMTLNPYPGATGDVIDVIDADDGTSKRFVVRPSGAVFTMGTEPADADLANGQLAWWFDPTVAAPVVQFKAKDAAGAVFVADLPMTPA